MLTVNSVFKTISKSQITNIPFFYIHLYYFRANYIPQPCTLRLPEISDQEKQLSLLYLLNTISGNPILKRWMTILTSLIFYKDMQRWSFNLQVFFLKSRFRQIMELKKSGKKIVQDRTIYEDAQIFAPNLHAMGLMTTRDFENYVDLFSVMDEFITPPDLLIFLRATVPALVDNIGKRGREYEEAIRLDYLNRLNERYEAWISTYNKGKMLVVDIDSNRFPSVG